MSSLPSSPGSDLHRQDSKTDADANRCKASHIVVRRWGNPADEEESDVEKAVHGEIDHSQYGNGRRGRWSCRPNLSLQSRKLGPPEKVEKSLHPLIPSLQPNPVPDFHFPTALARRSGPKSSFIRRRRTIINCSVKFIPSFSFVTLRKSVTGIYVAPTTPLLN